MTLKQVRRTMSDLCSADSGWPRNSAILPTISSGCCKHTIKIKVNDPHIHNIL